MATNLTRTLGTPSSQRIGTLSFWVKRCRVNDGESSGSTKIIQYQGSPTYFSIYMDDRSAQANWSILRIHMDDTQSPQYVVGTKMRFRDCSAWYHVVISADSSLSTAEDRVKSVLPESSIIELVSAESEAVIFSPLENLPDVLTTVIFVPEVVAILFTT